MFSGLCISISRVETKTVSERTHTCVVSLKIAFIVDFVMEFQNIFYYFSFFATFLIGRNKWGIVLEMNLLNQTNSFLILLYLHSTSINCLVVILLQCLTIF